MGTRAILLVSAAETNQNLAAKVGTVYKHHVRERAHMHHENIPLVKRLELLVVLLHRVHLDLQRVHLQQLRALAHIIGAVLS